MCVAYLNGIVKHSLICHLPVFASLLSSLDCFHSREYIPQHTQHFPCNGPFISLVSCFCCYVPYSIRSSVKLVCEHRPRLVIPRMSGMHQGQAMVGCMCVLVSACQDKATYSCLSACVCHCANISLYRCVCPFPPRMINIAGLLNNFTT